MATDLNRHQASVTDRCALLIQNRCSTVQQVWRWIRAFMGQWGEGEIRQEVGVDGGQAGRSWSAAIGEKEVAGNVGFSGGGVGRGSLSILRSTGREGARGFLWKQVPACRLLVKQGNYFFTGGRRQQNSTTAWKLSCWAFFLCSIFGILLSPTWWPPDPRDRHL